MNAVHWQVAQDLLKWIMALTRVWGQDEVGGSWRCRMILDAFFFMKWKLSWGSISLGTWDDRPTAWHGMFFSPGRISRQINSREVSLCFVCGCLSGMLARKLQPTPLTYVALINSCKFFEWPRALHFWHQTQAHSRGADIRLSDMMSAQLWMTVTPFAGEIWSKSLGGQRLYQCLWEKWS